MSIFNTDILVDSLILALHSADPNIRDAIGQVAKECSNEMVASPIGGDKYKTLYVDLIKEVVATGMTVNDVKSVEAVLLKFKTNPTIANDIELQTTLKTIFTDTSDLAQDRINFIVRKIRASLLQHRSNKKLKTMYAKLSTIDSSDPVKAETVMDELRDLCAAMVTEIDTQREIQNQANDSNTARLVDFQNKDSLIKALDVFNRITVKNRFKTGLQAMNRALNGGFALGSSIVFNSRAHNAKSLMLLKMARWVVDFNVVSSEFKNPTCLFFSLENETPQNMMQLFRDMYINTEHKVPPADMDDAAIATYCHHQFNRSGWKLIVDRRLGANFGYPELVAAFETYERQGYTPLVCIVDYANMMRKGKGSSESSSNNLLVKELYTNLCNFLKSKNCTFITAHQLNRKADELVASEPVCAVKRFGADMLSDSISVQREVDIVFYQNKEVTPTGKAFLTFKLDKHRYENNTPEKYKYFAYPFSGELGLLDDINGQDMSTQDIYAYEDEENNRADEFGTAGEF